MGVPFEALIPYGIMIGMFGITGAGMSGLRYWQSGKKRGRHGLDNWDKNMINRDRRLTGDPAGQSDAPKAPPGFELSSIWALEKRFV